MLERYKTIYCGGEGEIIEKKSRFIATVRLVESEEEALSFIEEMRKKYWNATHNCFAYVIGENRETVRCSDDGEPSGTAGKPMLDVLLGEGMYNTAVVVTRYFGGTLLGTGGLVRAYSKAVQEGLAQSDVIEKQYGAIIEIGTDYNGIGKIQYLIGERKIPTLQAEYTDKVKIQVILPIADVDKFKADLTEATNGRAKIEVTENLYYAILNGKVLMGEDLRGE
ncbi:MAG: YigZ family protein [Ruminococcus sp.]|nr:YigZ family protein [Ruminococcus sp.]